MLQEYRPEFLGQIRPADTNFATLCPGKTAGMLVGIESIFVSNVTAAPALFRICASSNGATPDEASSLFWDIPLNGNTTTMIEIKTPGIVLDGVQAAVSVRSSVASALTFTATGLVGNTKER